MRHTKRVKLLKSTLKPLALKGCSPWRGGATIYHSTRFVIGGRCTRVCVCVCVYAYTGEGQQWSQGRGVPTAGSAVESPSAPPSDLLFLLSHPLLGVVGLPRREGEDRRHTQQHRLLQCERSGGLGSGERKHSYTSAVCLIAETWSVERSAAAP